MNESFKEKINNPLLITSFILYILILIWVVFFKGVGFFSTNKHIIRCINKMVGMNIYERFIYQFEIFNVDYYLFILDLLRNFLIFLPFGIYLPLLFSKNNVWKNSIIVILLSLGVELIELITGIGGFEFLDIVNNYIGFLLGYIIYKFLIKKFNNTVINYICLTIVIIALPFAIYDYVKLIINFNIFSPCFNKENYINLFTFK